MIKLMLLKLSDIRQFVKRERSGSVVECLTLNWRQKGRGFEPHRRQCVVVLEQDTFIIAKYWLNPGRTVPI